GDSNRETLNGNGGNDILLGDYGKVTLVSGFVTRIETTDSANGGDDTIQGHDGHNVLIGGVGADTIVAGNGNNVALGDSGYLDYVKNEGTTPETTDIDEIASLDTA